MSISGEIEKTDDNGYAGWIASINFDVDVAVEPNPHKREDRHPDFRIMTKTPRGRLIRVGSAWNQIGRDSGAGYLSISIDVNGQTLRANALEVRDKAGCYEIVPFIQSSQ